MVAVESTRLEHPFFLGVYWILVLISLGAIYLGLQWHWWWLVLLFFCPLVLLLYGRYIEPYRITVKTYALALVDEPKEKLRVVFLSDFHASKFKSAKFFERVIAKVKKIQPDVVLIGGDLVEEHAAFLPVVESLAELTAKYGKYFILGNHDYLDDPHVVRKALKAWGYHEITNNAVTIHGADRALRLIGLDDCWHGASDLRVMDHKHHTPCLLVVHEPDSLLDIRPEDADLILMGHTHGGQIRLPLIGKIRKLPQVVPQSLDRGLKKWHDIPIIISQGLGEAETRARLFCPPQIVVVEVEI